MAHKTDIEPKRIATVSDLLNTYPQLPEIYAKQMRDSLFRWEPGSAEVLSARHIEDVLRVHRETFGRYWASELLKMLGASELLRAANIDTLTSLVVKLSGHRSTGMRFRRSLMKYQMRRDRLTGPIDVVPVSELYSELRSKVLSLAA